MLLQILAMFAQFKRDMIIDRVIAGMERKAAKGLWKGGRRPFGYQVDKIAKKLIIDAAEATTVRLIFDLYVRDRLGTKAIASVLNNRGLRTKTLRRRGGLRCRCRPILETTLRNQGPPVRLRNRTK
ncbi:recombinase family protein [Parafrankia sp. FMc6]|uniref:recombinase family protein n=1 Tax=Parafrankia soli TaxID=2599596 RepID=UPI0034D6C49A